MSEVRLLEMIYKTKLVSAILLLFCLCLPLSGRYVDGPLITVFKKDFIWNDFDPQEPFSWPFLFAFLWPLIVIHVEHRWHEKPTVLAFLQIPEVAAGFFSCVGIATASLSRFALIGTYLACTALGIFSIGAIVSFFQYLYSEVERREKQEVWRPKAREGLPSAGPQVSPRAPGQASCPSF